MQAVLRLFAALVLSLAGSAVVSETALGSAYVFGDTVEGGSVEKVWDPQLSSCPSANAPDLPVRAFHSPDGNVTLTLPRGDGSRRLVGSSLDALDQQSERCAITLNNGGRGNSNVSSYQWIEWVAAPYRLPNDRIAALVYNEFLGYTFNPPVNCSQQAASGPNPLGTCWERGVTSAISDDGGATYTDTPAPPLHRVANLPYANQVDAGAVGYFAPTNIVSKDVQGETYYYSLINGYQFPKNDFVNELTVDWSGICVMRTKTPEDPSSWRAYGDGDGDGQLSFEVQFVDPYANPPADPKRHLCFPINHSDNDPDEPGPDAPAGPEAYDLGTELGTAIVARSVTYNTFFHKYMLIGNFKHVNDLGQTVFYSLSDDLIDWSPMKELIVSPDSAEMGNPADRFYDIDDPNDPNDVGCDGPAQPLIHPTLIDPSDTTTNFEHTDQTVDLYFTRRKTAQGSNGTCFSTGTELVRIPLTFKSRGATGAYLGCPQGFDRYDSQGVAGISERYDENDFWGNNLYRASIAGGGDFVYGSITREGDTPSSCEFPPAPSSRAPLSIGEGEEVWYSGAFQFPSEFWSEMNKPGTDFRSVRLLTLGSNGPGWAGKFTIDKSARLRFLTNTGGAGTQVLLDSSGSPGVSLGQNSRWHLFQVHQKLSSSSSQALNEVWIDGVKQNAAQTQPNYPGEPQTFLRAGIVERLGDIQPPLNFDSVKLTQLGG